HQLLSWYQVLRSHITSLILSLTFLALVSYFPLPWIPHVIPLTVAGNVAVLLALSVGGGALLLRIIGSARRLCVRTAVGCALIESVTRYYDLARHSLYASLIIALTFASLVGYYLVTRATYYSHLQRWSDGHGLPYPPIPWHGVFRTVDTIV